MQQYRKKPGTTEAIHWDGTKEGVKYVTDFFINIGLSVDSIICREGASYMYITITEKICYHIPREGWVIKEEGKIRIMNGADFTDAYEPVSAPSISSNVNELWDEYSTMVEIDERGVASSDLTEWMDKGGFMTAIEKFQDSFCQSVLPQSEGGLQWVKEIKKYKEWLQSELSFIEAEKGMYPRSARIQGRKRAIENCSERFEQIFGSVQPQIESGLQWVPALKCKCVPKKVYHAKIVDGIDEILGVGAFEEEDGTFVWEDGASTFRTQQKELFILLDSASPSTANTEEAKREQQIAFAEWIRENGWEAGFTSWVKNGEENKDGSFEVFCSTSEGLYDLFLTETKQ